MERILTVAQMRAADEYTVNSLGFSRETLIERAGTAVAEEIRKRLRGGRVLVCCGKGNNGADGKVIAKVLSGLHGFTVATLNVDNGIFKMLDKKFDIIVDCIFGTGLNKPIDGKYKTAIEKINASGAYIVACDIPSGINGDTGKVMGIAVKANLTVAVQEFKLGHFLGDGRDYCGTIVAKDIGISIWGEDYCKRINDYESGKYFAPRPINSHKGTYGRVTVVGGSKDYTGSALLSLYALTAFKSGVGYSTLAIPESLLPVYAGKHPECIVTPLHDDGGIIAFNKDGLDKIMKSDAIAFGMGAGVSEGVYKSLKYLIENYGGKLLIDADGLNCLAKYGVDILKNKTCKIVVTPHVGEFARLTGKEKDEISGAPVAMAKSFASSYGVTVALKSASTIITNGKDVFVNTTGNSGLAKAGSGDVLSGFAAGLLAAHDDICECVAVACYLFGKAGEIAAEENSVYAVTASDVVSCIGKAIKTVS